MDIIDTTEQKEMPTSYKNLRDNTGSGEIGEKPKTINEEIK